MEKSGSRAEPGCSSSSFRQVSSSSRFGHQYAKVATGTSGLPATSMGSYFVRAGSRVSGIQSFVHVHRQAREETFLLVPRRAVGDLKAQRLQPPSCAFFASERGGGLYLEGREVSLSRTPRPIHQAAAPQRPSLTVWICSKHTGEAIHVFTSTRGLLALSADVGLIHDSVDGGGDPRPGFRSIRARETKNRTNVTIRVRPVRAVLYTAYIPRSHSTRLIRKGFCRASHGALRLACSQPRGTVNLAITTVLLRSSGSRHIPSRTRGTTTSHLSIGRRGERPNGSPKYRRIRSAAPRPARRADTNNLTCDAVPTGRRMPREAVPRAAS